MIYDLHSHILPGVDHGSINLECSKQLLQKASEAGIGTIVATPHFYMDIDSADEFLHRRDRAYAQLRGFAGNIRIIKAAEVALMPGIEDLPELSRMCVGDTKYIMLEMPSDIWNDWVFNAIYVIRARRGLIPVIAHIDRYNEAPLSRLLDMGLITQVNAEALLPLRSRTKMLRLFSSGLSHVLGSDVHRNTDAYDKFSRALKILGRDRSRRLMKNAQTILSGGEIAR